MNNKIEKIIFEKIFRLLKNQNWLSEKEVELFGLLELCDNLEEQVLLIDLLDGFTYLSQNQFDTLLDKMVDYIVLESGFDVDKVQIAATAYDKEADSSQAILHLMKSKLQKRGWGNVQTVNSFGGIIKTFNKSGLKQIVLVDEFIGSGKTLRNRIAYLKNNINFADCHLKCCFMVGIGSSIKMLSEDLDLEIFCPLALKKGISENPDLIDVQSKINLMKVMEQKLDRLLAEYEDYSLGYYQAEALYSGEGVQLNTPNSVFPIFWWPLANNKSRTPIVNRYQKGLI